MPGGSAGFSKKTAVSVDIALLKLESEGFVLRGQFSAGVTELEWCERRLLARIHSSHASLLEGIRTKKDLTADLEAELKSVLDAFVKTFA